jgi:hypothetical protein
MDCGACHKHHSLHRFAKHEKTQVALLCKP